jgi:nucleotide-binding universal stress UspA family protein
VINFFALPALASSLQAAVSGPAVWRWRDEDEDAVQQSVRIAVRRQAARFIADPARPNAAIELTPRDDTPWSTLMRELPLADFVVVGRSQAGGTGSFSGPLGESLMEAKAPVFVAQRAQPAAGEPAVIAWDGSLGAGRAIRAALPVLKDASSIAILQHVDEIDAAPGSRADPDRVIGYLAGHGLTVERTIRTHGRNVGAELLEAARGYGASLLVAGAYGHSRLGEALLGGATRTFLAARDGPHLLLAH